VCSEKNKRKPTLCKKWLDVKDSVKESSAGKENLQKNGRKPGSAPKSSVKEGSRTEKKYRLKEFTHATKRLAVSKRGAISGSTH